MKASGSKYGFTLLEVLVAVSVMAILASISVVTVRNVIRRTRYSRAQAELETIVLALRSMHIDTGMYPESLDSLSRNSPPGGIPARFWMGPYLPPGIFSFDSMGRPLDPWGNPYHYARLEGVVCGPGLAVRHTPPKEEEFSFTSWEGSGEIFVMNLEPQTKAAWVKLNGEEVVSEDQFRTQFPEIRENVMLSDGENTITMRNRADPENIYIFAATSEFSEIDMFLLAFTGADGKMSGSGHDAPIIHGLRE